MVLIRFSPFPIRFNHWFDGMALLHQFKISDGQVTYKSRFLTSDSYQTNKEHNRITVSEFGTITMPDPCKNFFQRFLSRFELPSEFCVLMPFIRDSFQFTLLYIETRTPNNSANMFRLSRAHR